MSGIAFITSVLVGTGVTVVVFGFVYIIYTHIETNHMVKAIWDQTTRKEDTEKKG